LDARSAPEGFAPGTARINPSPDNTQRDFGQSLAPSQHFAK
jgi:hypothetical protein